MGGFGNEEGAMSQQIHAPLLEAGKGKEMDSLLEPPGEHCPDDYLILAQWDPFFTSDLQNYKIIDVVV